MSAILLKLLPIIPGIIYITYGGLDWFSMVTAMTKYTNQTWDGSVESAQMSRDILN